jgi:hypothetical protein
VLAGCECDEWIQSTTATVPRAAAPIHAPAAVKSHARTVLTVESH